MGLLYARYGSFAVPHLYVPVQTNVNRCEENMLKISKILVDFFGGKIYNASIPNMGVFFIFGIIFPYIRIQRLVCLCGVWKKESEKTEW